MKLIATNESTIAHCSLDMYKILKSWDLFLRVTNSSSLLRNLTMSCILQSSKSNPCSLVQNSDQIEYSTIFPLPKQM